MGIPVVLPSSPTPRSLANHSAKPSWSNGSLSSSSSASPSPSTSSSSSFSSSSRHHRLLQDNRPPLSTLAYVPPPSASWGTGVSPASRNNSISSSEPTSNTASTSSRPPLLPSHHYTSATGAIFLSTLTTSPPPSLPSIASGLEQFESPPPWATTAPPSRVRAPPNLRRISRVPVFVTAPSTLVVAGPAQGSTATPSSLTTPPSSSSSQSSTTPPGPSSHTPQQQQQIWHPSSPSLVYYLTRPLPPPPPPLAQPMASEDNVRYDHNSYHWDQSDSNSWNTDSYTAAAAAAAEAAARVRGHHVTSTSSTGTNVNNHQHDPDHFDDNINNNMNTRASLLRRSYSTMLQGDSSVLEDPTHGRYVNRDHPDNRTRPDLAALYSGHHSQNHHRHPYPQRTYYDPIRQQPHQQQFDSPVSYPESVYSRTRIDTGGEGDLEDAVDPEYDSLLSAPSGVHSRLMDRRARMRPRERERERDREREREAWASSSWTSSTVPLVNTPDFLRGYVVDDDETTQASISLNSQSSNTLGSSGTVRRTGRTLIRADAIHPGVIHIYPENHAPIWMYGRPTLSPSPSSSSSPSSSNSPLRDSLPSPPSSDDTGTGSENEADEAQLLSIPLNHSNDLAMAATDRDLSLPSLMLPRPPPSASAPATVSRRQLNRYANAT